MIAFDLKVRPDVLTERVIGAAIEVHRQLGPGLLESVYLAAMEFELLARGISFASEVYLPVRYKGSLLDGSLRLDLVVERELVVELKSQEGLLPVHCAQVLTYLKTGGFERGLLINFNVSKLVNGVRRFVR
ncbi:MAG: GxxExxY protein [Gemmatimonadetes bacterium]|nr:GxxExxY protein [Gemmatimonadota bacterium]